MEILVTGETGIRRQVVAVIVLLRQAERLVGGADWSTCNGR